MISKEQVFAVAKLARLKLEDREAERFEHELSEVLDYFDILKEADTEGVEPMTHAELAGERAREDVAAKERPEVVSLMVRQVSSFKDGFLKVKSILSWK
ncbi:MAG: Asp-tRNA(Asn)/Glu-tRNA(Gln) amidotransferase subunit GatC [bacterium]|nr:Asp-tRNA(Asn)/Glu-tRNA(Gln) amidotransferase subunit GatC [bacterium]